MFLTRWLQRRRAGGRWSRARDSRWTYSRQCLHARHLAFWGGGYVLAGRYFDPGITSSVTGGDSHCTIPFYIISIVPSSPRTTATCTASTGRDLADRVKPRPAMVSNRPSLHTSIPITTRSREPKRPHFRGSGIQRVSLV
jgi:hypothetical protein